MATPTTCECGRTFTSFGGWRVHSRTCPVERERSNLFVEAVQAKQDPHDVLRAWRVAGRPLGDVTHRLRNSL